MRKQYIVPLMLERKPAFVMQVLEMQSVSGTTEDIDEDEWPNAKQRGVFGIDDPDQFTNRGIWDDINN